MNQNGNRIGRLMQRVAMGAACAIALSLGGCADDSERSLGEPVAVQNLLELAGERSGGTEFLLYAPESSEAVTLTSTNPLNLGATAKEGDTYQVQYRPLSGDASASGRIAVLGIARVNNLTLKRVKAEDVAGWEADPVWVTSVWRAGSKVNMRLKLAYDNSPRTFGVEVDESTLDEEYPTAYLAHIRQSDGDSFYRQYYVSVDCSGLWALEGVKGMKLHIKNANQPEREVFTIDRP